MASEFQDIPTDLISLIYDYLPDEDPIQLLAQGSGVLDDTLRDVALARMISLDTVVKNDPRYYAWFAKHRNITSLHLSFSGADIPTLKSKITNLLPYTRSFSRLTSLHITLYRGCLEIFQPLFEHISDLTIEYTLSPFCSPIPDLEISPELTSLTLININAMEEFLVPFIIRLARNPRLVCLSINDMLFEASFTELTNLLEAHPEIETLEFALMDVKRAAMCHLFESFLTILPRLAHLTTLILHIGNIAQSLGDRLNIALQSLPQLRHIDILPTNCGFRYPAQILTSLPNITHISVDNIDDDTAFNLFLTFLETHPHLQELRINSISLNVDQSTIFASVLSRLTELEVLRIHISSFPYNLGNNLSECFQNLHRLKRLELIDVKLTTSFVVYLSQMPDLVHLDVHRAILDDEALRKILAVLENHPQLETLTIPTMTSGETVNTCLTTLSTLTNLQKLKMGEFNTANNAYHRIFATLRKLVHLRYIELFPPYELTSKLRQEFEEVCSYLPEYL